MAVNLSVPFLPYPSATETTSSCWPGCRTTGDECDLRCDPHHVPADAETPPSPGRVPRNCPTTFGGSGPAARIAGVLAAEHATVDGFQHESRPAVRGLAPGPPASAGEPRTAVRRNRGDGRGPVDRAVLVDRCIPERFKSWWARCRKQARFPHAPDRLTRRSALRQARRHSAEREFRTARSRG
jgi:hypothetical protein